MLHDLQDAVRTLSRTRGLTIAAIVSLGLGIGANVTIFGWMKSTVLQPFPGVTNPDGIVVISGRNAAGLTSSSTRHTPGTSARWASRCCTAATSTGRTTRDRGLS
jgi:hypothetical protein